MCTVNNTNYQKELEKILSKLDHRPKLLLHSCCAPCSSYCLIYLLPYFDITCFYFNPNITDEAEYEKRFKELVRLADELSRQNDEYPAIKVIDGGYDPKLFIEKARAQDLEKCPEGGRRCEMCFSLRLSEAYDRAVSGGYEYFTTTLTISPLKDAKIINMIGERIAQEGGKGVCWLPSDFKKNDGYKQSIELSKRYNLYRQNYCGCVYSKE